jgi:hypothetical protein
VVDCGSNQIAKERAFPGDRRATAAPGDLFYRAAEIEIDMVDAALVAQRRDGPAQRAGVDAVELEASWALAVGKAREVEGLGVSLDQPPRRRRRSAGRASETGRL